MTDELTDSLEQYIPQLIRLAERNIGQHLRGKVEAEDVAASACRTFLRRYGNASFRMDADDDLWKLLVTITLNKVRQKARKLTTSKRDVRRERRVEGAELATALRSPPGPAEAAEFTDLIHVLAEDLDSTGAQVLQLVLEGESRAEIADRLDVSTRTVSRKLGLIREKLLQLQADE